jgi:hypothetical protein
MSWQLLFALWVVGLGGFLGASLLIISRRSERADQPRGWVAQRPWRLILPVAFVAAFALSPQAVLAKDGNQPRSVPSNSAEDTQTILPSENVHSVLGKEVRNGAGENLGRIVDVLIDQGGQVRAVVIDFGGFLGVGARRLVVDSTALHPGPDTIMADITRDQARAAPEYKPGKPIFVLGGTKPTATPQM